MRKTVNILGVQVDKITMTEAVAKVEQFLSEGGNHAIYTPNAEIIMAAQRDAQLMDILNRADLIIADGAGVVLAAKLLGVPLPEKVSGVDLTRNAMPLSEKRSLRVFIFGGKPGVAETAGEKLAARYPGVVIAGCRNGYFSQEEEDGIIKQINEASPDILLVSLGAPRQEKWIHAHKGELNAKVSMGVGGTVDIIAGNVKLAPEFMRRHGFEWLYRLCREPRRYKRMLDLPRFMTRVMLKRLGLK